MSELKILRPVLAAYKTYYSSICTANLFLAERKVRLPHFPSCISEVVVKEYLWSKNIPATWNNKRYDLQLHSKKLEVKAFLNPMFIKLENRKWDQLFLVDARDFLTDKYHIYHFPFSSNEKRWLDFQIVNKKYLPIFTMIEHFEISPVTFQI